MPRPRLPLGAHGDIWTIPLDDGRVKARAMLRTMTGKRRQVERIGASEQKAVTALRVALRKALETTAGTALSGSTRLDALLREHIDELRRAGRSPATLAEYERVKTKHLDAIGELRLEEVTAGLLWQFLAEVQREHGSATAKTVRSVLSGAFGRAVKAGAITSNPIREVRLDGGRRERPGSDALPLDGLPAILERIKTNATLRDAALVDVLLVMAGTGVRVGEACALRWEDYDAAARTLTVCGTNRREKGVGMVRQPFTKSDAGQRMIVVPAFVADVLDARERRGDMIFTSVRGGLLDGVFVGGKLAAVRDELGAPNMTSHSFRKTGATALDAAGLSARAVSDYLGHAHVSMTQDKYLGRALDTAPAAKALDNRFA